MNDWYTIRNLDELDTPALVIYPERVKNNLNILKTFVEDIRSVRPHIKTNKCPQVVRLMLEAGLEKFKCATIAEAEMLAMEGAKDVLLAYQPLGPKSKRFCELQQKYPQTVFSCLIDDRRVLEMLSGLALRQQQTIRVYVDLNVGMNRTGISPGEDALGLCRQAMDAGGIVFMGLHVYDGHLRDADLASRSQRCEEAFAPVSQMRVELKRRWGKDIAVVAGGTPTFPIHAKRKDVQPSPGTFIFWDKTYQQLLAEQPFQFAALVVTRVISVPDERTLCLDLGHKSIAAENPLSSRVHLLNGTALQPVGHSEEHMVFRSDARHNYQPGDVFYGVPQHICPTVALYDDARVCVNNTVSGMWPILARKRKLTV